METVGRNVLGHNFTQQLGKRSTMSISILIHPLNASCSHSYLRYYEAKYRIVKLTHFEANYNELLS
jgi:hypothetical protein